MLRLLLLLIIGVLVYRALKPRSVNNDREKDRSAAMADDVMVQDPVCGIYFPRRDAVTLDSAAGQICFCSSDCRDRYLEQQQPSN